MSLHVFDINKAVEWDNIVKSFRDYDIFNLSCYAKIYQQHGDGEPLLIYFTNDSMRAINVVMRRDISWDKNFTELIDKDTYFDLATPYGYGGFISEGEVTEENIKALNDAYCEFCILNNIISEFTRFHPILRNYDTLRSYYDVITLGKTITIQLSNSEEIWSNLSHQCRTNVRKARDLGVEINNGRAPWLFDKFLELYNTTMDKNNASEYYYFKNTFFDSILKDMTNNSMIFYAQCNSEIVAMSIVIYANQKVHLHLCASDMNCQQFAASNLLYYEIACWACDMGYETLHLGSGVGGREDGLFRFKKGFNKNSDTYLVIGEKIFDKKKYSELLDYRNLSKNDNSETTYIPAYRAQKN